MTQIKSHRDLLAWQRAMDLVLAVYQISASFPGDERFGLISQVRRASVSVPSNIAEGYGRGTSADYVRFLRAARGSLYEVDTQLLLALRMGWIDASQHAAIQETVNECGRILAALIRSVEQSSDTR